MRWIPPFGMIVAHLAHGVSWPLLAWAAFASGLALAGPTLAWIHAVVLAWFSVTALAILVHVIPAFTDAEWRRPGAPRVLLAGAVAGAAVVVAGFAAGRPAAVSGGGLVVLLAAVGYTAIAVRDMQPVLASGPRAKRAVAAALAITLAALAAAAALGCALALALGGKIAIPNLARVAAIHGQLGAILWLGVLIIGVSVRTFNPIFGAPPQAIEIHRRISTAFSGGTLLLLLGLAVPLAPLAAAGAFVAGAGGLGFAANVCRVWAAASVRHRLPQAFVLSSAVWLAFAVVAGWAAVLGAPLAAAYLYLGLIGWIGMMVLGHMHHIGTRLLLTVRLGEDDETRPEAVLDPVLGWVSFWAFQLAVVIGASGAAWGVPEPLAAAALFGFAGWACMSANAVLAYRRSGSLPISLLGRAG